MDSTRKFLHDRIILLLATLIAVLLAIGILSVLIRFDISKNPTTIVAWRPNISGSSYQSGKPIDIYSLAIFMAVIGLGGTFLAYRSYALRRFISVFILASSCFLLLVSVIVANALISLQ